MPSSLPERDSSSPDSRPPASGSINRREFILSTAVLTGSGTTAAHIFGQGASTMYGLIAKIDVVSGQRDALAAILVESVSGMPGCLSYVVANDAESLDALWVTEVWDSRESHSASLSLPSVQSAMREGRPLIAGFSQRIETTPLGGYGLG